MFRITTTTEVNTTVAHVECQDWSAMFDTCRELERAGLYSQICVLEFKDNLWTTYSDKNITPAQNKSQRALNTRIANEKKAVKKIVERAIRLGYMVSLYDGEEYTVKRSVDKAAIMAAVYTTDMDRLYFRVKTTGEQVGSVLLVYGNSASEVMADWSDCPEVDDILADAKKFCDQLADKGL